MKIYDSIVIGGGLSGLIYTNLLLQKSSSIKLIESRNRLGGRVETMYHTQLPNHLELGGKYIAKFHRSMRMWCEALNVELINAYESTNEILPKFIFLDEKFVDNKIRMDLQIEFENLFKELASKSKKIDWLMPWNSSCINSPMSLTVESWLKSNGFSTNLINLFADVNPKIQSFIGLLALISAADGEDFFSSETFTFKYGASTFIKKLENRIPPDIIELNSTLEQVEIDSKHKIATIVVKEDKHRYYKLKSKSLIITIPPSGWNYVKGLQHIYSKVTLPTYVDNSFCYFTVKNKLSDTYMNLEILTDKPYRIIWTENFTSYEGCTLGIYLCPYLNNKHLQKTEVIQEIIALLKLNPNAVTELYHKDWTIDRWSNGSFPIFQTNTLCKDYEIVFNGIPPIFFSGDYKIPGFAGYMEGAVRSAEKTYDDVVKYLNL